MKTNLTFEEASTIVSNLQEKIKTSIFGQDELITEALCCLLAGGHILMTGAPGLAKTTLVRVIASYLGLSFGRVQFTPDLLPTDIIGSDILNIDLETSKRTFEFAPGPIFVNLLLADEINRASPRTQSALLEAMQESSCTVSGKLYNIDLPFMVFATQNPLESEGTFPLPEAELDRFLLHSFVKYPDKDAEAKILSEHVENKLFGETIRGTLDYAKEELSSDDINSLITQTKKLNIEPELITVIRDLIRSTRPEDELFPDKLKGKVIFGASPRAGISLISTSRALALINKSETVRWAHIKRLSKPVLRHRIRLSSLALRDTTEDDIIDELLKNIETHYDKLIKG